MADEIVIHEKTVSTLGTEIKRCISGRAEFTLAEGVYTLGSKKNSGNFGALNGIGGDVLKGTVPAGKKWNVTIIITGEEVDA